MVAAVRGNGWDMFVHHAHGGRTKYGWQGLVVSSREEGAFVFTLKVCRYLGEINWWDMWLQSDMGWVSWSSNLCRSNSNRTYFICIYTPTSTIIVRYAPGNFDWLFPFAQLISPHSLSTVPSLVTPLCSVVLIHKSIPAASLCVPYNSLFANNLPPLYQYSATHATDSSLSPYEPNLPYKCHSSPTLPYARVSIGSLPEFTLSPDTLTCRAPNPTPSATTVSLRSPPMPASSEGIPI